MSLLMDSSSKAAQRPSSLRQKSRSRCLHPRTRPFVAETCSYFNQCCCVSTPRSACDAAAHQLARLLPQAAAKTEPETNRLIAAAVRGDRAAFGLLVRRHQRQAFAVAYRLLGNQQDAMDVTQDAFVKAYKNLATLRSPGAFSGWLLRIVSNLSLNFRRSRKTRETKSLDEAECSGIAKTQSPAISQWMAGDHNPIRRLEAAELGEKLRDALSQLPPRQQQAIVLFTIEQMPQKEVARVLNCSVEAVKWHVFQGRQRLRKIMERYL